MILYNDEERGITIPNGIGNVEVIKETQDLTGYATEEWVENNFASNSDVDDEIGKLESSLQGEIDKKQPKGEYLTSIPDEYVTENEFKTINGESILGDGDITIAGNNANIIEITQEEFDNITPESNTIYVITDAESIDIAQYATQEYVDNKLGDIETILDNIIGL